MNEYAVPFYVHIDRSHEEKRSVYWSEITVIRTQTGIEDLIYYQLENADKIEYARTHGTID